jgi:hypothetical protein
LGRLGGAVIIAPTTVGAVFVSLSTVIKADRLLTLYKSKPPLHGKAVFLLEVMSSPEIAIHKKCSYGRKEWDSVC